jgi:hypothetical protein
MRKTYLVLAALTLVVACTDPQPQPMPPHAAPSTDLQEPECPKGMPAYKCDQLHAAPK